MDTERWWSRFVDVAVVVWIALFAVDVAAGQGAVHLQRQSAATVRLALTALLAVFLLDVALLYRWSEKAPVAFARSNWFWILTVVPWFRPLRVLRLGRGLRGLRLLARSRRAGSLLNKLRRMAVRAWRRRRD